MMLCQASAPAKPPRPDLLLVALLVGLVYFVIGCPGCTTWQRYAIAIVVWIGAALATGFPRSER